MFGHRLIIITITIIGMMPNRMISNKTSLILFSEKHEGRERKGGRETEMKGERKGGRDRLV
jgi:hypothetical protein